MRDNTSRGADDPTYQGCLVLLCSSSVHRLRLPLSNQGLAQCGKDVIHVICIRHDELTSRIATKERKRNKPQSHYKDNRDIPGQEWSSFM